MMNIGHLARPATFYYLGDLSVINKLPQIPLQRNL